MSRMRAVAMALALFTGASILPASAQTGAPAGPVLFQILSTRGETLYYDVAESVRLSLEVSGASFASGVEQIGREAIRTLDVAPDGSMKVEVALEDFSQTVGGRTQNVLFSPVTFTERPDGEIVDLDPAFPSAEIFKDVSFELPRRPLAAGDSWSTPFDAEQEGMHIHGTTTITLMGVESTSDGRVGHFRTRMDGTVSGGSFGKLPPGVQINFNATARGAGATDWSVDLGRLLETLVDVDIEGRMDMSGGGQTLHGTLKGTVSLQAQALAPGAITVPAVPADRLITAGKGIGTYTLGQPVAELESDLGAPTVTPGAGKRPTTLAWVTGLAGYVDAIEPGRVLSLQIDDDLRFRTDKGIGCGSSRGAVLIAYGLSPAEVQLLPDSGDTPRYALIYDDLGIAFTIATKGPLFIIGGARLPANTVMSVTVFPPGGAAEIFPLLDRSPR
jgi:hypothetical protein